MLYRKQTFAPRAFHSELQQQTNTVNTQKSPPWACDKGCADACADRFSALKVEYNADLSSASLPFFCHHPAILDFCGGYRWQLVPRLPFPVPRSPLPVPRFSNIPYYYALIQLSSFVYLSLFCSLFVSICFTVQVKLLYQLILNVAKIFA